MPFESDKQRRFMFAKHPGIARRWVDEAHEEGVSPTKHKKKKRKWLKRSKAEQMEKSMDLVDIYKAGFLRSAVSPATFRAVNGPPVANAAAKRGSTLVASRPGAYQPNPITMAAMEGFSRRRAAKQLRQVKKSWEPLSLVEISKYSPLNPPPRAQFGPNSPIADPLRGTSPETAAFNAREAARNPQRMAHMHEKLGSEGAASVARRRALQGAGALAGTAALGTGAAIGARRVVQRRAAQKAALKSRNLKLAALGGGGALLGLGALGASRS